jgi:4-amino-4-deoxy-L-arabinose transferase-like glycosyltransferase
MNRRVLSDHRAFLVIIGAFIALALAYSVSTPLFEAPDEQWHYAFVQYVAQGHGLPVQSSNPDHLARQEASQPPLYYQLAAAAAFWVDSSDFPAIIWENPHYGYDVPGVVNDNKNLFIHTAAESFPYRGAALAIHLARFVSILFGAVAVLFTYLLAGEIFREERWLAAGAAGLVAFLPQFIFVSGAVSNDSAIVATSALSLWLMVRLCFIEPRWRDTIALGAASGLAALAKVSGLGIVILAALVVALVHRKNIRSLALHLLLLALSFSLVAAWWYARNWFLYGEFTGTEMMLRVFGERGALLTVQQLATQFGEVWETFWIGFGWGNIRASSIVYAFYAILLALSAIGWLISIAYSSIARGRRASALGGGRIGLIVLGLWALLTFTALLRWMEVTQAPHGRLFFPVLPALAPLIIFGLALLLPPRSHPIAAFAPPVATLAISLYALFFILRPAYAFSPTLTLGDAAKIANRVDIVYDGKMKLLGYDVTPKRALPDSSVDLTLYWQALVQMDEDYSIGIALLDADRRVLSQRNSYPGHGTLPTRLFRPGQMIRDTYWMPVPAGEPAPSLAQIQVTLFRRDDKRDLAALDPKGNAITPIVGRFKIASAPQIEARPQNQTNYVFGNEVALIGYDLRAQELEITLYWKRMTAIADDYTVFVHLLDGSGKIVAQRDSQPSGGRNPTSLWDDGEIVVDHYSFDQLARGTYQVRVGLYRADTNERLGLGNGLGDSVILGPVEVGQ